jgi:hypothetical protein
MSCRILLASLLAVVAASGAADAQTFSARRMAMGGVVLADGGAGGDGANVAYRAVPREAQGGWALPLPIGLIPVLADPPQLDPDDPDFNVYELANLLYNPPWNLQLVEPATPGNDITVVIGKDRLSMDLGEIRSVFPADGSRQGAVVNGPALGFGVLRFFVAAAPQVFYQNELTLNDALLDAMDGTEFRPNTRYEMLDGGSGMAALGAHLGWAGPLMQVGDPRGTGMGLYAGARVKLMRGMAYGRADNAISFTTEDTLFGADPVDVGYVGHYETAGPDGGGLGRGLDLGAVWMGAGFEVGLGVNDIGTRYDWRVRESVGFRDPETGDYEHVTVREDKPVSSTVPTTAVANAAMRLGRLLVAADVVRGVNSTTGHLGGEAWLTPLVALRAGAFLDANEQVQVAGGTGLRLGPVGLDLAVGSHSRNLTRERGLELGAGLALYR